MWKMVLAAVLALMVTLAPGAMLALLVPVVALLGTPISFRAVDRAAREAEEISESEREMFVIIGKGGVLLVLLAVAFASFLVAVVGTHDVPASLIKIGVIGTGMWLFALALLEGKGGA